MHRSRIVAVAASAAVLVALLAGCVPQQSPGSTPNATSTSGAPTPTPTVDPTYDAVVGAAGNKAYFDLVNTRLIASNGGADGRTLIDNLVSAGFDKAAMQVTPDKTSINGTADSILFSVQMADSCLIGQRGPGSNYSSAVDAALKTGGCLVGKTRPINW